ncbi:MAG TPA: response regulator transcription factor [Jatrophihabitans sp.]|nr:response regulator transcription factor [Jatrophihabitans sp.]
MTAALRVLIADDDGLMRAGLRAVLSSDESIEVVAEAHDGRSAIAQTRVQQPDVVLMDVQMPDMDGITATREIAATLPQCHVLILTTFEDDDYVLGALRAGAAGFLLKRAQPEQLIAAIHTIAAGDALLDPSVTRSVISHVARQPLPPDSAALGQLTPRERDVLELIARGLSNAEIAAALVVEESTVKTHVKRVLAKLELRDRVQAVIYAYESGIRSGDG